MGIAGLDGTGGTTCTGNYKDPGTCPEYYPYCYSTGGCATMPEGTWVAEWHGAPSGQHHPAWLGGGKQYTHINGYDAVGTPCQHNFAIQWAGPFNRDIPGYALATFTGQEANWNGL